MDLSLSTRWNACRHKDGQSMIEEILRLGFKSVELGYDLTVGMVPGVISMVSQNAVRVVSLHNFCPVPMGAPSPHPELFELSSDDQRIRESAVHHTAKTIDFAAQVGATVVVAHAGNVHMKRCTPDLMRLAENGQLYSSKYDRIKMKLFAGRESLAARHLDSLRRSIEELLPMLSNFRITLALETLPFWEAIPTEMEMSELAASCDSPFLAWWLDIGHEKIRENLGFVSMSRWVEKLHPRLAGFHVHDVRGQTEDHVMPPNGTVDFAALRRFVDDCLPVVLEPAPMTDEAEIRTAREFIMQTWNGESSAAQTGSNPAGGPDNP